MGKCTECENIDKNLADDPRVPPLDIEPCLCTDCYICALEEAIEEMENDLEILIIN